MAQRSVPTGEENDAAAKLVEVAEPITADPEAATTGGEKLLRCRHNDRFELRKDVVVTGAWAKFPARLAKEIIEAASANGVRLSVADPIEKKG